MDEHKRLFSKRKIVILASILLVAIITTGLLLAAFHPKGIGVVTYFGVIMPFRESFGQKRLLCATDHQALLNECKTLSRQTQRGERDILIIPDSELSRFPVIHKLGSREVTLSPNEMVSVEFGGTMRHFGVQAYPEDCRKPSENSLDNEIELVPGLRYYDDEFNRQKDYDEIVEELLRKNKTRKRTRIE